VNAEQFRRRLHANLIGDDRAPIAACAAYLVYPRRFISTIQARAMRTSSQPVVVGLPENP
jgi:hypothetical protein